MAVQLYTAAGSRQLHALVGYEDGEVAVWNVHSGQILASKHFHKEPVMAVAVDAGSTGVVLTEFVRQPCADVLPVQMLCQVWCLRPLRF